MNDSRPDKNDNRDPFQRRGSGAPEDSGWRKGLAYAKAPHKWHWMIPWTLAAIGVAVTIAWVLQPSPEPQQNAFRGRGGPGGLAGGGARGGGGARNAQRAATPGTPRAGAPGAEQQQGTAVGAAVARTGDIDVTLNALGTVTAAAVVTIRPQIGGQLQKVAFTEGQLVQKGDFLAQIDPRPYEIQKRTAEANLSRDKVLLDNAKRDLARYEELIKENAISQQQLETQRAEVGQYTAAAASDESAIASAALSLTYCHIVAPITGRIGLRQVDEGNYVSAGETNGIGVVAQVSPITVVFTLPEDTLPQIQKRLRDGAELKVEAYDRSNVTHLATGTLAALDNLIDPSTGTVKLKASFENRDASLFPNQFVNVRLLVDTIHNTTVLPPTAIQHGAPGTFVFLIKPDDTVGIQTVKTGVTTATLTQMLSGVNPGDQVVIDGVDRLREGAQVYVPNAPMDPLAPPPSPDATGTPQAIPAALTPNQQRRGARGTPNGGPSNAAPNGAAPNGAAPYPPGVGPGQGGQRQRRQRGTDGAAGSGQPAQATPAPAP